MTKGYLIVVEGIDGSGKTTQIILLSKSLKDQGVQHEIISFPRYKDNIYGKLIKRYLEGEFGGVNQTNPYLIALTYAGDRLLAKPKIEKWLNDGKVVIANRYVSSSKAHLGANLPQDQQVEFMNWLDKLEYETNGIPKEDLTILLMVDPKAGQNNVLGKHGHDIHEENLRHEEKAAEIFKDLGKKEKNWFMVDCMKNNQMRQQEDIHKEILSILDKFTVHK